jgi:hypothetical protein
MRPLLYLLLISIGLAVSGTLPARAADRQYPVCLHIYGPITYDECRYTSLAQCALSAVGGSAQCMINPFYAPAGRQPRRR